MKKQEFITRAKDLGYIVLEVSNQMIIKDTQSSILLTVTNKSAYAMDTYYKDFFYMDSEAKRTLFALATEYATTPIKERQLEGVTYYLRHKWLTLNGKADYNYLNVDLSSSGMQSSLSDSREICGFSTTGTIKQWEKRTGRSWKELLSEFNAEEIG